ncbi:MAG: hypothetical protein LW875_06300 [Proteobacteria bacterium]|jgi:hypothetical protein|nr:hypothetical protein [Pseudomonadota bacterium]
MKWLNSFRQFVIYTVSLSLAWPANTYAMSKDSFKEIKSLIETSEIAQREVSLKDFYSKNVAAFPTFLRIEIENILAQDPQAKMPKIQVTKLKGDDIQISFVWGGKSQSLILTDNEKGFAKMGDVVFSREDLYNHDQLIKKLEIASQVKEGQWRSVPEAFARDYHLLSARQMGELTLTDRERYIKDIRDLMEAVEKVQNKRLSQQQKPVKTSLNDFDLFWGAILEKAHASGSFVGQACVVAGFPSRTDSVKTGRDAGKIVCSFERVPQGANTCGSGQMSCNPAFYGTQEGGQSFCVSQKNDATSQCNQKAADTTRKMAAEFNPDKPGRVASQWEADRQAIESELARAIESCRMNASALREPARGGLNADQAATCVELEKRLVRIKAYTCQPADSNNAFFKAYENWCAPARQPGNSGGEEAPPADCNDRQSGVLPRPTPPADCNEGTPARPSGPPGTLLCSNLPRGQYVRDSADDKACENGIGSVTTGDWCSKGSPGTSCSADQNNPDCVQVFKCSTQPSQAISTAAAGSSGSGKKKSDWVKWAAIFGGGILMFWAASALTKRWTRDFVNANVPATPIPPITVPPTPTIPRGAR